MSSCTPKRLQATCYKDNPLHIDYSDRSEIVSHIPIFPDDPDRNIQHHLQHTFCNDKRYLGISGWFDKLRAHRVYQSSPDLYYSEVREHRNVGHKYLRNAQILLAGDFNRINEYFCCHTRWDENKKYLACGLHHFCPLCAHEAGKAYIEKYHKVRNRFHLAKAAGNQLVFLTYRPKKVVLLNGNTPTEAARHWDGASHQLNALFRSKVVVGGFKSNEFTVPTLYPTPTINPHVHAIVETPDPAVFKNPDFQSHYSVHATVIKDEYHFQEVIRYITKSTDFYSQYAQAVQISVPGKVVPRIANKKELEDINLSVRNTFFNLYHTLHRRKRFIDFGSFKEL